MAFICINCCSSLYYLHQVIAVAVINEAIFLSSLLSTFFKVCDVVVAGRMKVSP